MESSGRPTRGRAWAHSYRGPRASPSAGPARRGSPDVDLAPCNGSGHTHQVHAGGPDDGKAAAQLYIMYIIGVSPVVGRGGKAAQP